MVWYSWTVILDSGKSLDVASALEAFCPHWELLIVHGKAPDWTVKESSSVHSQRLVKNSRNSLFRGIDMSCPWIWVVFSYNVVASFSFQEIYLLTFVALPFWAFNCRYNNSLWNLLYTRVCMESNLYQYEEMRESVIQPWPQLVTMEGEEWNWLTILSPASRGLITSRIRMLVPTVKKHRIISSLLPPII